MWFLLAVLALIVILGSAAIIVGGRFMKPSASIVAFVFAICSIVGDTDCRFDQSGGAEFRNHRKSLRKMDV